MVFCPHLPDKTCMIYGTFVLDISQRMLYDKHPYMSQVYPLSLFLLLHLPAKDVLWERWLINHFCPLIKGPLDLLHWFTWILLVLCQLNHARMPNTIAQHFQSMTHWAETFTGQSLISIHSDQGGKFLGKELQTFFSSRGITHQTSVPHTSQQNGRAKRFNQTLLEKAEAIQQHACLPRSFWQDVVETALHIYNQQPMCRHLWKTPIEIFNGDKPDVSYFRVFGLHTYVFISPEQ